MTELNSLRPIRGAERPVRRRLRLRDELVLAFLPTVTTLVVLAFIETVTTQRLLFASLAASAFLIYLDPKHATNSVRTLVLAQSLAAAVGLAAYALLGAGIFAAGAAMVVVIVLMILADAVHPPAVATGMSFALRAGNAGNLLLFGLALAITAVLVLLEHAALWILARVSEREE